MNDLFSSAYFPTIAYLYDFIHAQHRIIDTVEHFIKQTHRNRMLILSSNGIMPLIIPIEKNDVKNMHSISISYREKWQDIHWKAIYSSYKNSPYFEHYEDELYTLFHSQPSLLIEWNQRIFQWVLTQLDVLFDATISTTYVSENIHHDYRTIDYTKITTANLFVPYKQVFYYKYQFIENLSVLDLLCNKGPESFLFIQKLSQHARSKS